MSNSKFLEFRKKYPKFIYKDYNISEDEDSIYISFNFEIAGLESFNPKIIINKSQIIRYNPNYDITSVMFKNLVFNLGLIELISYYKIACPKQIDVKCGYLTGKQINFIKKLIYNGLGEFFYVNDIEVNEDELVKITTNSDRKIVLKENNKRTLKGQLIPVGGGKDSCVSLEILESLRSSNTPFIINVRGATLNTVKIAKYEENYINVTRILDENMIRLNKEGFLNGHTPFSAMVAFCSVLVAYLTNKKYVVLSNESSANEPSVIGSNVNHQYSKSFEFENDFRNYEKEFLKTGVEYFSILRPLNELQIAMLFSKFEKYHMIFRSCNVGSKEDKWCTKCSKCLFVYIILSPFLSEEKLISIFGTNILDDIELKETFMQLIGERESKPFDCVGTYEEINYAICKTISNIEKENKSMPKLLEYYIETHLDSKIEKADKISKVYEQDLLNNFESNNLEEKFEKLLKKALKRK